MEQMVFRVTLQPNVDVDAFRNLAVGIFAGMGTYVAQAVLDYADPEEMREQIQIKDAGPSMVETSRFYIQIAPELRMPISRMQFTMLGFLLQRGVIRGGKQFHRMLGEVDHAWAKATLNTLTGLYNRTARYLEKTPWPLIRGRRSVYGFKHCEAILPQGRRSVKNRALENEV